MTIRFNKKIYSHPSIKQAIKAYNDLAEFRFSQNKNYFLVETKNIQSKIKKFFPDEFSNYVLSLMKK